MKCLCLSKKSYLYEENHILKRIRELNLKSLNIILQYRRYMYTKLLLKNLHSFTVDN